MVGENVMADPRRMRWLENAEVENAMLDAAVAENAVVELVRFRSGLSKVSYSECFVLKCRSTELFPPP